MNSLLIVSNSNNRFAVSLASCKRRRLYRYLGVVYRYLYGTYMYLDNTYRYLGVTYRYLGGTYRYPGNLKREIETEGPYCYNLVMKRLKYYMKAIIQYICMS